MHAPSAVPGFCEAWSSHERRAVRLCAEAVCCYFDTTVGTVLDPHTALGQEARRWFAWLLTHELAYSVDAVALILCRPKSSVRSMLRTRRAATREDRRYIARLLRRIFAWQNRRSPVTVVEDMEWYSEASYGYWHAQAWRRDMTEFLRPAAFVAPIWRQEPAIVYMPC